MDREVVSTRLPESLLKAVDTIAKEQTRTRANVLLFVLTEWLKEHRPELLPPEDK